MSCQPCFCDPCPPGCCEVGAGPAASSRRGSGAGAESSSGCGDCAPSRRTIDSVAGQVPDAARSGGGSPVVRASSAAARCACACAC